MTEENLDLEQIVFNLVLHAGNARGNAYEALDAAEEGDFEKSEKLLDAADKEFIKGHKYQNILVQGKVSEKPNFLIIHSQDHLMTAMAEKNLIKRFITLYKKLYEDNE